MKTITLDFETYYDDAYSLRKMTPVEYILNPRFEVIGCAVKEGSAPAFWLTSEELRSYLRKLPAKVAVLSHNALFDMCILAWVFDYVPHLMIDTLGMARAWLGHTLKSLSLASVALHLGIGVKGTTVHQVKGMGRQAIIDAGLYASYSDYACNDADLCYDIYVLLMKQGYPSAELAVMDTVIRCAVKPRFVADQNMLATHLNDVLTAKQTLLARCGLTTKEDLMSNDRLAAALRGLGVEPPRKISLTTGLEAYAFAKTDQAFTDLEEHDDPDVQALVSARLGVKSTLEESRTQRFINISYLTWPSNFEPAAWLPIPIRYGAAHTHRLGGDWKLNVQNLPSRKNKILRTALRAPPRYEVVSCDASQIEARIVAWLCGQTNLVDKFAAGADVYSEFASGVFNKPVNKKDDPLERFVGKQAILGLGYGLGFLKFFKKANYDAMDQLGVELGMTEEQATGVVKTYRTTYPEIPKTWKLLSNILPQMCHPGFYKVLGPIVFKHKEILLPSGLSLYYHNLQYKDGGWWFSYGGKPKYIYGGKMLENIVQALARIIVMDAAIRIRRRLKDLGMDIWLNLQVHDDLIYIVKSSDVAFIRTLLEEEMSIAPAWGVGIPLAAESKVGASYGEA